jgi:phage terminase large subunit-like protein
MKLWCDEIPGWKYPDACWEQAEFGLRLGAKPQTVITTTAEPFPSVMYKPWLVLISMCSPSGNQSAHSGTKKSRPLLNRSSVALAQINFA